MGKTQATAKTLVIANRKGGVGKTQTAVNLGVGLAKRGKRVLCVDADSQHSLTVSFGLKEPEKLTENLATVMARIANEQEVDPQTGIVHHQEGVDIMPANSNLAAIEISLAGIDVDREMVLRQYVDLVKPFYDYIIIDTSPSPDLLTINALAAADSVIIPVCPKLLDANGLVLLLKSVAKIQRRINPALTIGGILFTMVDKHANLTNEVMASIERAYGGNCRIFAESVPRSVRAAETSKYGVSIFTHDPKGKVAAAYAALVGEVLAL